ncbi:unnamed protein product [Moneuplotes crassus]|uniref:Uncharacterized protein n=1 Tax=Euplotes crassus TaxID=5936 RepID=A0AAD1XX81_EUPCR|nr:unnamed protein product [Moneuplotes crassus]
MQKVLETRPISSCKPTVQMSKASFAHLAQIQTTFNNIFPSVYDFRPPPKYQIQTRSECWLLINLGNRT